MTWQRVRTSNPDPRAPDDSRATRPQLLDTYDAEGFFDEVVDSSGQLRAPYRAVFETLNHMRPEELAERAQQRDELFRDFGVTFAASADGPEVPWPMDLVPRIIDREEWRHLETGLIQRIRALDAFLEDIYVGDRAIVRDGVIPWWLIASSQGFCREAHGLVVPRGVRCAIAGIDVVRGSDGTYRVLEDNVRTPSGISYILENRRTFARIMPGCAAAADVLPVDHFGDVLRSALQTLAPGLDREPQVVVLTPGPANSAYFEHTFLARVMGVPLVEARDLVVRDHAVFRKTIHGLVPVDVIYRRIDDAFLDPTVFRADSLIGVPGLMAAARAGRVTVVNPIGNGLADDKGIYPYVPQMVQYYLGEEVLLPNIPTLLPWEEKQREEALDRIAEMVIKPVAESGGYGVVIGPDADAQTLEQCRENLMRDSRGFIVQELVELSRHPTWIDGRLQPRHIDLRPFVISGASRQAIPGGLTRVALEEDSLIVNSSQGGGAKDTWVLTGKGNS